jgi:hypothetical protein
MLSKVERICDGFSKVKYDLECAFNQEQRELKINKVEELIKTQILQVTSTRKVLRDYLQGIQSVAAAKTLGQQVVFSALKITALDLFVIERLFLERERLVYNTLNKFTRQGGSLLLGFVWIPVRDVNGVLTDLQVLKDSDPDNIQMPDLVRLDPNDYHDIQPPTLFQLNEFTWISQ